jgi:hypothetical protein
MTLSFWEKEALQLLSLTYCLLWTAIVKGKAERSFLPSSYMLAAD